MSGLTLLGTGTCQLQADRTASCVLIETDTVRFVFDFGRGTTFRLTERNLKQNDLKHIILSHFHPDHLSDLIPYLQAACWSRIDPRTTDLHVYGPAGLQSFISSAISLFGRSALTNESFSLQVHEVPAGDTFIEDLNISFVHLPPHENHGIRFTVNGKTYAISGDSDFHRHEIDFLRNADVGVIDAGHISDDEIMSLAVQSGIPILVCSHLYRSIDAEVLTEKSRSQGFEGTIIEGYDGLTFQF